jgi:hypothetical protein
MNQLPSIFRKPTVYRTQGPVPSPFSDVPLNRLKLLLGFEALAGVVTQQVMEPEDAISAVAVTVQGHLRIPEIY